MRTRRETGRSAVAAVLPKLVLLASVLLGIGLSHATAHYCGMPMSGAPLSHSSMQGMPPTSPMRAMSQASAMDGSRPGASMDVASAHEASAVSALAYSTDSSRTGVATHEGTSGANPFVLCLTAVAAILVTVVLGLIFAGRLSGAAGERERTARLPAVRRSPSPFALSLRRVTVLRV
ncbi:hypothetical protein [Microtetraspora sp. NBRC 16547]|uniref:hypothetical protein n=1 Tax=Microtetraspora sp. NBRC 16547 TaxID=3030993 RepID=UPI0024A4BE80|nr:hypothetical protein [Microtetraspora sp. NBRC 16547]GLW99150.1 hypothetical protein Misp02_32370 [Microtetraspora sp. NBRC 16547]